MMSPLAFSNAVDTIVSEFLLDTYRGHDLMVAFPVIPFVIRMVDKMGWKFVDEQKNAIFFFYPQFEPNDRYLPKLTLRIRKDGNEKIVDLHNLSYAYSIKKVMDAMTEIGFFGEESVCKTTK